MRLRSLLTDVSVDICSVCLGSCSPRVGTVFLLCQGNSQGLLQGAELWHSLMLVHATFMVFQLQTKLPEWQFCLVEKWLASARAEKGKCLWAQHEGCWKIKAHARGWNLESSCSSLLWTLENLHWPAFMEHLFTAFLSEQALPFTVHCAEIIYGFSFPRARWLLAWVFLEGARVWHIQTLANLSAEKEPRSSLVRGFSLYLPTVHDRYCKGVYGLCWYQNYHGSVRGL